MSTSRLVRCSLAGAAGVLPLLLALGAAASQDFPSEVQKTLDMPCPPPCTLCHTTQIGQAGTAVKPFLIELRNQGLMATPMVVVQGGDEAAVAGALAQARITKMDSDKDMVPDTDELTAGLDPNTAGGDARICGPAYGCGARIAKASPNHHGSAGVAALAVMLVALGLRRRR